MSVWIPLFTFRLKFPLCWECMSSLRIVNSMITLKGDFLKNNKPLYAPCFFYAGKFSHILIQWTYVTAKNIKIDFLIRYSPYHSSS